MENKLKTKLFTRLLFLIFHIIGYTSICHAEDINPVQFKEKLDIAKLIEYTNPDFPYTVRYPDFFTILPNSNDEFATTRIEYLDKTQNIRFQMNCFALLNSEGWDVQTACDSVGEDADYKECHDNYILLEGKLKFGYRYYEKLLLYKNYWLSFSLYYPNEYGDAVGRLIQVIKNWDPFERNEIQVSEEQNNSNMCFKKTNIIDKIEQSVSYFNNRKYDEARSLYLETLAYCDSLEESDIELKNLIYQNAIISLNQIGERKLAFSTCMKALSFYQRYNKDLVEKNGLYYILDYIGRYYFDLGFYDISCKYYFDAAQAGSDIEDSIKHYKALNNLTTALNYMGKYEDALIFEETVIKNIKSSLQDSIDYDLLSSSLNNLAYTYQSTGRYKEALRVYQECDSLLFARDLLKNQQMKCQLNMAMTYYEMGDVDITIHMLKSLCSKCKDQESVYYDILGTALNNLGMCYLSFNYATALEFAKEAYDVRKIYLGERNPSTIQSLYNVGICNLNIGNVEEGTDCIKKSLEWTENTQGESSLSYANQLSCLSEIYKFSGDYKRALQTEEKVLSIKKELIPETHLSNIISLEQITEIAFLSKLESVDSLAERVTNLHKQRIIHDFIDLTSSEKINYVRSITNWFDNTLPNIASRTRTDRIVGCLYNAVLLRKGLLMYSEIDFRNAILESNEKDALTLYDNILGNKALLRKQLEFTISERTIDVDSLQKKIKMDEDNLVVKSKDYGIYTKKTNTDWMEIQSHLTDSDIAIEFYSFPDSMSKMQYVALLLKKKKQPTMILIGDESIITQASNDKTEIYKVLWKPILDQCKNITNIYFAPSGILNNIGIEYAVTYENKYLNELYSLNRLSSTREIVCHKEINIKKAAIFGNLDYETDYNISGLNASNASKGMELSSNLRSGYDFLSNTILEISGIGDELRKGGVETLVFTKNMGTEESLKKLSNKRCNLIHFATHGGYIEKNKAEDEKKKNNLLFIRLSEINLNYSQEDEALSRSFLVMSGGNMLLQRKKISTSMEDGILTAEEISQLDFRGVELVVLSACQTALGDISNEGVYGLQRGFKKAGANTILMSLDKVDDEATRILMVEFYRNLMNGKSKLQSLHDAQQYLRIVENGKYDDPKYWASFIMLDGLN